MGEVFNFLAAYHNELLLALPVMLTVTGWLIRVLTNRTKLKWSFLPFDEADSSHAARVAIWNAGPQSIRWFEQSRVSIESPASIIVGAALLGANNPDSRFGLLSVEPHRANIRFAQLDKHDGAVIEVSTRDRTNLRVTGSFVGGAQPTWVWDAASRGFMYALHVQRDGEKSANRYRWMSRYSTTSVLVAAATGPFVFYEYIRPYFWFVLAASVVGTIAAIRLTLQEYTSEMPRSLARLLIDEDTFPSATSNSTTTNGWKQRLTFWRWLRRSRNRD
jgi:hypothetical protein